MTVINQDNLTTDIIIDRDKNYQGIPPYNNAVWKSVYEGVSLEIQVVDHCNLNCAGCNHFSPLAEPWYIDIEDFRNQIIMANKKIPNIRLFMIVGGEPTLHPQLFELCKIAREVFPKEKTQLKVLSNGLDMRDALKHKEEYLDMDVMFDITTYGKYTNHKTVKYCEDYGIAFNHQARMFMRQQLVNEKGDTDPISGYYQHCPHEIPCFTLKNYKIYICPFSAHLDIYRKKYNVNIPEEKNDYLCLEDINSLDDLHNFIFSPKNICKYCDSEYSEASWLWHKYYDIKSEFVVPMENAYFEDYDFYLKLINDKENFLEGYNEFLKGDAPIDFRYNNYYLRKCITRFIDGKIDIIIPYYNLNDDQIINLFNSLSAQTIIKDCCVYLISDNSAYDKKVIEIFDEAKFPCFYLKNKERKGPGSTRNLGLENSFNKYIIFWDSDDLFNSENELEYLYKSIKENDKADFLEYLVPDNDNNNKIGLILKREFLEKYNIKYSYFCFCEDSLFLDLCDLYGNGDLLDFTIGKYITNLNKNPRSISHDCSNQSIEGPNCLCKTVSLFLQFIYIFNLDVNNNEDKKDGILRRIITRILCEISRIYNFQNNIYGENNNYYLENYTKLCYFIFYQLNLKYPINNYIQEEYLCPLSKKILKDVNNNDIHFHCLKGNYIDSFDKLDEEVYPILNYFNGIIYYKPVYEQFLNYLNKGEYNLYD